MPPGYPQEGYTNGVWDNANTLAPWDTDQGDAWLNALAAANGNESNPSGWNWQNLLSQGVAAVGGGLGSPILAGLSMAGGAGLADATGGWNPFTDSWSKMLHSISGKGHKRSSPNFYAPSYQGLPFMPKEGLGDYVYGETGAGGAPLSMEVQQTQQQNDYMQQQAKMQADQYKSLFDTMQGSFYDYNGYNGGASGTQPQQNSYDSFKPNYVGQRPYGYDDQTKKIGGLGSTFTPTGATGASQYGQY